MSGRSAIGVDVGGTFTKAVAVEPAPLGSSRTRSSRPRTRAERRRRGRRRRAAARCSPSSATPRARRARRLLDDAGDERPARGRRRRGSASLGIGAAPDLRAARKRTRVGPRRARPGACARDRARLRRRDARPRRGDVDAALATLAAAGCDAVAVSGALAVDDARARAAVARARARTRAARVRRPRAHGAYGLEMRTVSAADQRQHPARRRTDGGRRREALAEAGLDVPLLVLRGDGGAMSIDGFRRVPRFTVGSGPGRGRRGCAAPARGCPTRSSSSAAARARTSPSSSTAAPILRSLRVMGRPTCIRAIDSWVVGAAGGSMALLRRRRSPATGPRSAHIAGLPYACFAEPAELDGARARARRSARGRSRGVCLRPRRRRRSTR